jgi:hypothetical protein
MRRGEYMGRGQTSDGGCRWRYVTRVPPMMSPETNRKMTSARIDSTAAIADFLNHVLAGGALAVAELEAKARAAGLLGERQQIQHAKAFKKAKKQLGIQSIRNGFGSGGKWAWLMAPEAAIEVSLVGNSHLDTKEQDSAVDAELRNKRLAASQSRSIVEQWIEGVQRLDYLRCPTLVPLIRWHLFLGDCHSFLSPPENWAERAATLGWNALALFGCYRTRPLEHLGSAGLLWAISGGKLVELYRDWAIIERQHDKSRQVYHRRRQDEAQVTLPWIGLRAKNGTP